MKLVTINAKSLCFKTNIPGFNQFSGSLIRVYHTYRNHLKAESFFFLKIDHLTVLQKFRVNSIEQEKSLVNFWVLNTPYDFVVPITSAK